MTDIYRHIINKIQPLDFAISEPYISYALCTILTSQYSDQNISFWERIQSYDGLGNKVWRNIY